MKKVISVITLALLIVISLSLFTQAQAAWYDWLGWSKIKSVFIKEKGEDKKETPVEVETKNQDESKPDTIKTTPKEYKPTPNIQKSDAETNSLRVEIATLKANLDNLYKAHSELVEDHNQLLKYTSENIEWLKSTKSSNTGVEPLKSEVALLKTNLDNLYKAHSGLVEDHNKLLKYTADEISDLTSRYNNLVNAVSELSIPRTTTINTSDLESKVSNLESKVKDICKLTFSGLLFGDCPSAVLLRESLEYRIEKLERLIK